MDGYGINIKIISPRTRDGSWAADQYVIVGPRFSGDLHSCFNDDHTIRSLSRFIFILGRTEVYSPDDVPKVSALLNGYTLASLDGREPQKTNLPIFPFVDTEVVSKSSPEAQVFFSYANFIINYMEIEDYESDLFKRFAKIDVGPSKEFIGQEVSQQMYRNIQDGIADGAKKIDDVPRTSAVTINGWTGNFSSKIVHGDYLWHAACIKIGGLYTNDPEEALYHVAWVDIDNDLLDSMKYDYTLTFSSGQFPPVAEQYGGFWSVTAYLGLGPELGTLVHNPIDRYAINGMTTPGLVYDTNGALTLYIQKTRPNTEAKAANWLPAPDSEFGGYETGEFHLVIRLYVPEDLYYFPPGIVKASPTSL